MRLSQCLKTILDDISGISNENVLMLYCNEQNINIYGFRGLFHLRRGVNEPEVFLDWNKVLPLMRISTEWRGLRVASKKIHNVRTIGEKFFVYSITITEEDQEHTRLFLSEDIEVSPVYLNSHGTTTSGMRYSHFTVTENRFRKELPEHYFYGTHLPAVEIGESVYEWLTEIDSEFLVKETFDSIFNNSDATMNTEWLTQAEYEIWVSQCASGWTGGTHKEPYWILIDSMDRQISQPVPTSIGESVLSRAAPRGHKFHVFPVPVSIENIERKERYTLRTGIYLIPETFWSTNIPSWPEVDRRLKNIEKTRPNTDAVSESNAHIRRRL
jgi:hypothetical protein